MSTPKNIVLCSDGTGQMGSLEHSNAARMFMVLNLDDPNTQSGGYLRGVGTALHPEVRRAVARTEPGVIQLENPDEDDRGFRWLEVIAGMAFGYGVIRNVLRMYEALIDHYNAGDRIYLFGFSRGAFTVRVLAGLLHRCGVLLSEHKWRAWEAFDLYKPHYDSFKNCERRWHEAKAEEFKATWAQPCTIQFLGLWDTVKSVGFVWPKSLPHTRRNPSVLTVRHALAMDERRSLYVPTSWGHTEPSIEKQDVEEVWFAGAHSDVGGGYGETEAGLAQFSFEWMLSEAINLDVDGRKIGLLVDDKKRREMFSQGRTSPNWLTPHDELAKCGWRVLEWVPRLELENDRPPPKRLFRWGPSGERQINNFRRNGKVLVHSSTRKLYADDKPPWSRIGYKVEFL